MPLTLALLPQDILLIILTYLSAPDLLRLSLTCSEYKAVFTDPDYVEHVLRSYPHAYESRSAPSTSTLTDSQLQQSFRRIAARYHHLSHGRARNLTHLPLRALDQSGHWLPTPQWDYHESQPGGRLYHESAAGHLRNMGWKPYLFRQTLWSYDDGLLVYAPALKNGQSELRDRFGDVVGIKIQKDEEIVRIAEDRCLNVLDLETGTEGTVPFDVTGRIIRNLRIKEKVLIVEWAEAHAFHDLNMDDKVHRHFATCFDVSLVQQQVDKTKQEAKTNAADRIEVSFRSEWRVHFLGFPLSNREYFFSTHTSQHYALYYWQPNRSLWTGDDQPIEALFVYDISTPSAYRPSEDPRHLHDNRARDAEAGRKINGPYPVVRYAMRELEWLGIRQQTSVSLIRIELDSESKCVTWKENRFVSGQGYFDPAERSWESRSTTFPFQGDGCVLQRTGNVELVGYRGHCSMDSAVVEADVEKWFLPVSEVGDDRDRNVVRFGLIETCLTGMTVQNSLLVRVRLAKDDDWITLDDGVTKELSAMGRIAGDERWLVGQNGKLQIVVARFQ